MILEERVDKLRNLMKYRGITAYIVNTSEYVAKHYKERIWISG